MTVLIQRTTDEVGDAVPVRVDRHTLYKRRWRAIANDGTELAVDLESPVGDGAYLYSAKAERAFQVSQNKERVLVIPLPERPEMAAKIGWYLGNQHLPVEVRDTEILLEPVKTLAKSLDRIGIPYLYREEVFKCKMHSHQH
ncbi:MAG: hypothetical protein P1U89_14745 [Verrucomicrobiales bacterium]|nr:hypothetical protein [Verrucomicrobiales bacterium]